MTEILIAEDSRTQALMLENTLERHQYRVGTVARDGQQALDALQKRTPAMVITDIQMPVMDGYELCRRIKSDPNLRDMPVILLTSLSAPEDIVRGLECGADNFIVKPYEEAFLIARIESILANQELRKKGSDRGIPVFFLGREYVITSNRRQVLNLLLSTYETAVQQNADLRKAHEELKAAQAQLIEAEKMQSVGRLAAGVAHEVRNPLAIMEMGISLLSGQTTPDNAVILDEMKEAVRRANFVINELLQLSASKELGSRRVDLNGVIEQALALLGDQLANGGISVAKDLGENLPACQIDADKITQVFANIITNAIHAMPDGGALGVRTYRKALDAAESAYHAGDRSGVRFREGETVVVAEIEDSGSGIAAENLAKIFEPFFTTKPTGKGMGLGLTVVKKIIDSHAGAIDIRNRPEGGVKVALMFKCDSGA
jgi:signal transduction histidine kinase